MTEFLETGQGPVEFAHAGDGAPVLFVHGTPGGIDTSMAMAQFLIDAGHAVVAPARPGYQGTPLDLGRTIDEQADLLAELMSALGHQRFSVVSWSGGGPSSYRLAVRHPDRVNALVPFASLSGSYPHPKNDLETKVLWHTSFGNWIVRMLAEHAPGSTVKSTLAEEGDLDRKELKRQVEEVLADPKQAAVPLAMAECLADMKHREAGFENDWDQFGAIDSLELERVSAPTLVVVGDKDSDVDPAQSEFAARTVPGARRLVIENGTHISLFAHPDAAAAQREVLDFLATAR
jgi:pimeloyl-ACP methyl ester carboxylesterase